MPAKIEMVVRNGKLLPASLDMIQQQLEEFADAHRRLKTLDVSLDVGNPAQAVAEIEAPIGQQKFASKATANSASEAVEDAIGSLHRQLSQRRQERKAEGQQQEPVDRDASIMKIGKAVAAVLLGTIFAVSMTQMDSCTYNPANYPDTAPVTGTITQDGQPVEGATVTFVPSEGGRSSSGSTDANGKYELYYTGTIGGATLGSHIVGVRKLIPDPDYAPSAEELQMMKAMAEAEGGSPEDVKPTPPKINSLPERYSGSASELSAEVKSGKNTIDFDLTQSWAVRHRASHGFCRACKARPLARHGSHNAISRRSV